MNNKQFFMSVGLAGILFLTGCGKKEKAPSLPSSNEAIPVKIIALTKTSVVPGFQTSGQFTTDDETMLSFKTGGIINKVYVKEGDRIHKGQLLATLDLTEISAQMNQAQIAWTKASRDYQRVVNLYKDSVTTLEQLQNSKSAFEIAQQQLSGAKFNLSYSEIRSGSDGVVLRKLANEGQIVGPGIPVLETSGKGTSDWILRTTVGDKEWAQLSTGDKASVFIEALDLRNIAGIVYKKSESADPMTGSFSIDIKLTNTKNLNIASGMFGKAEIVSSHSNTVWKIPYDALLDGNSNEGFVFVTNDNKKAIRVPVKISSIGTGSVFISEGLADYTSLIVTGSPYLTDGSVINVVKN